MPKLAFQKCCRRMPTTFHSSFEARSAGQARRWICIAAAVLALAPLAGQSQTDAKRQADTDRSLVQLLPSAAPRNPALPRSSDVLFSPRFDRPEAADVAKAYGTTRMVWSYIPAGPTRDKLSRAVGASIGDTINNNIKTPQDAGVAVDFDGKRIIAPWMTSWGAQWNSCAAPATMTALKQRIDTLATVGIAELQFDDAGMQFDASLWTVGDFSAHSLQGFARWIEAKKRSGLSPPLTPEQAADYRQWLQTTYGVRNTDDYMSRRSSFSSTPWWHEYLKDTVVACVQEIRRHLHQSAGGDTILSFNTDSPYPWSRNAFLAAAADYVLGEVGPGNSKFHLVALSSQWLLGEGKRWATVSLDRDRATLRSGIATTYALGAIPVVPWDVFIPPVGSTPPGRFFGAAADLADLYLFVRRHADLFDDWEMISRVNLLVPTDPVDVNRAFLQMRRLAEMHVPYQPIQRRPGIPPDLRRKDATNITWQLVQGKSSSSDGPPILDSLKAAEIEPFAAVKAVSAGLRTVVKANPRQPGTRVIHLLREGPVTEKLTTAELTLNAWTLPSADSYDVFMHTPNGEPRGLGVVHRQGGPAGGLILALPYPTEWAVIEVRAR